MNWQTEETVRGNKDMAKNRLKNGEVLHTYIVTCAEEISWYSFQRFKQNVYFNKYKTGRTLT